MEQKMQSVINMRNRTTKLEREGDYWTKSETEQLCRMFAEGTGITDMALMLQRTEPAISQQIEKMDLYKRKDMPRRKTNHACRKCLCDRCGQYGISCFGRKDDPAIGEE